MVNTKESSHKTYDNLPLFLDSETVAKVLGVSPSSAYELMHEPGFPILRVGSHMVVAKEQFIQWVVKHTEGGTHKNMVPVFESTSKNFFSLPNELFFLNIGRGVTVYAYLLYCQARRTHQCHPSYRTISDAVHLTVSTVVKHITKLVDRQFITVENTSYIDRQGMKRSGNNQYTILPIQAAKQKVPAAQYSLGTVSAVKTVPDG